MAALYAVAVRDGVDLLLLFTVRRTVEGDVYVNFIRNHDPDWRPHSSYHASGQHHQKSFGHKALTYHRQRPDGHFKGTEPIVTTPITPSQPRAINTPCDIKAFSRVLEIPQSDLTAQTNLSFDLVEAEEVHPLLPGIIPGARIVRQMIFDDAIPWVIVTLFEPPDLRPQ